MKPSAKVQHWKEAYHVRLVEKTLRGFHGLASAQCRSPCQIEARHLLFGDMPAVPNLTPDDVAHITAYIRAQQRRVGIQ